MILILFFDLFLTVLCEAKKVLIWISILNMRVRACVRSDLGGATYNQTASCRMPEALKFINGLLSLHIPFKQNIYMFYMYL